MDFRYSEDQQAIVDLAGQLLAEQSTHERQRELEGADGARFDRALWEQLAEEVAGRDLANDRKPGDVARCLRQVRPPKDGRVEGHVRWSLGRCCSGHTWCEVLLDEVGDFSEGDLDLLLLPSLLLSPAADLWAPYGDTVGGEL